jgi:hypothetical protein
MNRWDDANLQTANLLYSVATLASNQCRLDCAWWHPASPHQRKMVGEPYRDCRRGPMGKT